MGQPDAIRVQFDSDPERINGFISKTVQDAIEEAKATALGTASRAYTICGFDGNASTNRWLEFYSNNPSNNSPLIVAEAGFIKAISASITANSTITFTLYKNGIAVETLTITAARKNNKKNLNITLNELDELSVQVTSGSGSRPLFAFTIQTVP